MLLVLFFSYSVRFIEYVLHKTTTDTYAREINLVYWVINNTEMVNTATE